MVKWSACIQLLYCINWSENGKHFGRLYQQPGPTGRHHSHPRDSWRRILIVSRKLKNFNNYVRYFIDCLLIFENLKLGKIVVFTNMPVYIFYCKILS